MQRELWKQNKISKFSWLAMYCPENICFKRHLRKKSTDSVRRNAHNYKWFTVNVLEIVKICRDLWSNLWDDCLITGATFILDSLVSESCRGNCLFIRWQANHLNFYQYLFMQSLTFFMNNRQRLKAKDKDWINESSIPFMWIHHQSLNQSTNTYLWIAIIIERERAIHHRELDKN